MDNIIKCEKCGVEFGIGQNPFCPHDRGAPAGIVWSSLGPGFRAVSTQDRVTGSELEYKLKHAPK